MSLALCQSCPFSMECLSFHPHLIKSYFSFMAQMQYSNCEQERKSGQVGRPMNFEKVISHGLAFFTLSKLWGQIVGRWQGPQGWAWQDAQDKIISTESVFKPWAGVKLSWPHPLRNSQPSSVETAHAVFWDRVTWISRRSSIKINSSARKTVMAQTFST